jgi:hypothetical protein
LIEVTDLLQTCLESLEILELPSHLGNLFAAQTDVANPSSGIRNRQHRHRMPLTSFTLRASLTVTDDPLQERSAQDVA